MDQNFTIFYQNLAEMLCTGASTEFFGSYQHCEKIGKCLKTDRKEKLISPPVLNTLSYNLFNFKDLHCTEKVPQLIFPYNIITGKLWL
jgi:hypothetical protein